MQEHLKQLALCGHDSNASALGCWLAADVCVGLQEEYNDDEAADEHEEEEQSAPAAAQPQAVVVAEHGGAGPANGPG